jgi:hypothetical protein
LIVGPKGAIESFNDILESRDHCENVFNTQINIFGVSNINNIYVQTFGYINYYFDNKIISGSYIILDNSSLVFYAIYNGCDSLYLYYNEKNNTMISIRKYIYMYNTININLSEYYLITNNDKYIIK